MSSVDILDSVAANLWPGDAVSSGAGAGTVVAVLSSGDDSSTTGDQLVVSIAGNQVVMGPPTATVAGRGGELGALADQAQNGVVA